MEIPSKPGFTAGNRHDDPIMTAWPAARSRTTTGDLIVRVLSASAGAECSVRRQTCVEILTGVTTETPWPTRFFTIPGCAASGRELRSKMWLR